MPQNRIRFPVEIDDTHAAPKFRIEWMFSAPATEAEDGDGHDIDRLVQQLGRAPTVAELAAETRTTEHDVLEALEAGRGYRSSSLDVPDQEGQPLVESIGFVDGDLASVEDKSVLVAALSELPDRDQAILRMRFVDGLTQSDIAVRFGVSQMQISRLLAVSIQRLRVSFVDEPSSAK